MILQFPRLLKVLISLLSLSPSMRHGFKFLRFNNLIACELWCSERMLVHMTKWLLYLTT